MSHAFPQIFIARHGQTEWALTGQHTGRTDIPLTAQGEAEAVALGQRLDYRTFAAVFTSPTQRARRTAELAGFAEAVVDPDLAEWDYGDFEGLRTAEIIERHPGWNVFVDGCPNGESVADMVARADRVVAKTRAISGDVLLFTSGHFARTLAARWLGQPITLGAYLLISTASLSILGYDHSLDEPAILQWNETAQH